METVVSTTGRNYFVGFYNGPYNISPFNFKHFDSLGQAMLFVRSKMEYFKKHSYGFCVYTDERIKKGKHYVPKTLIEWHNDGEDCRGELINDEVGWRIYIDTNNQIVEEHFTPKET